jgi:hypothetical protein
MKKVHSILLLASIVLATMCGGLSANGGGETSAALFDGALVSGTVFMDVPVSLASGQRILVDGDVTIDGARPDGTGGSTITFTDPTSSQLVLQPGSTLTLKNVQFLGLKNTSLDLRSNVSLDAIGNSILQYSTARLKIDQNVKWELDQDITFTNGYIELIAPDIYDPINIFVLNGKNTRKTFRVAPLYHVLTGQSAALKSFVLDHNTLLLENVAFQGVDAVSFVTDEVATGAISLSGKSALVQDVEVNPINLFVEAEDNNYIFTDTNYTLASNIAFGDFPTNELEFIVAKAMQEPPVINVDYDPGIFVFSAIGTANVTFANHAVVLNLKNENAMILDDGAMVDANNITTDSTGSPIKVQSTASIIRALNAEGAGVDTASQRSWNKVKRYKFINALQIRRQQARDALAKARTDINTNAKNKLSRPRQSYKPSPRLEKVNKFAGGRERFRELEALLAENDAQDFAQHQEAVRSIGGMSRLAYDGSLFANVQTDNTVAGIVASQVPYVGTWKFKKNAVIGDSVFGFTLNPDVPFLGLMERDARLYVKSGDTVTLDENHQLYVSGKNNVIEVAGTLNLSGNAFAVAPNTEVTLMLAGSKAQVVMTDKLELPEGSSFVIDSRGKGGQVILADGLEIALAADSLNDNRAIFEMRNNADVVASNSAAVRVTGIGIFSLGLEGHLTVKSFAYLIFGQDVPGAIPNRSIDKNDIIFTMHASSLLDIQAATVSFRYLSSDIICHGIIDMNQGILAINAEDATGDGAEDVRATPGNFRSANFNPNGVLSIHDNSVLVLGQNYWHYDTASFQPFNWDGRNATYRIKDGEAYAQLVEIKAGENRSFMGLINNIGEGSGLLGATVNLDATSVIRAIVQRVSGMADATVYKANADETIVRTKNAKAYVTMVAGNTVTGQAADGGVVGSMADGRQFSISVDGVAVPATVIA